MVQSFIKVEKTLTLVLQEKEAILLRALAQNPAYGNVPTDMDNFCNNLIIAIDSAIVSVED